MSEVEHKTLAAALCAAESEMPNAVLDSINPHYKNRYASLTSLRNASLKTLTKHGLNISHQMRIDPVKGFYLRGVLTHAQTNEEKDSEYPLPNDPTKPQAIGSAVTFGRRYTWSALVAIASEEDDDGERASSGPVKSSRQAKKDGDWERAVTEITAQQTTADLRAWGITMRDWINEHTPAWKEQITDRYRQRLQELGGTEGPPSKLIEDLKGSLAQEEEEDVTTIDPEAYLDDLDGAMAGAKDVATIEEIWRKHEGIMDFLPPEAQDQAQIICDRHRRRAQADAAVKAIRKQP